MISLKILDHIPAYAEIGVGLALRLRTEEYMFFLPGNRHANHPFAGETFYAGVGGHLEPGETLLECGKREALEEIGLEVSYESSTATFYIDRQKNVRPIVAEGDVRPLAIFEMIHPKGTPRQGEIYHIIIFKAFVDIEPNYFQETEVSGVILMSKEQVMKGNRRATVRDYIQEGARILGDHLNMDTILFPIGTAEALTYLKEGI